MQVVLNVLLFMPLGYFLRVLWGRGVIVSTATGLAVSAMIETTQITGVWGIYPCPYRLFDVDDLLANTSRAFLGAVLISLLLQLRNRWLPTPIAVRSGISEAPERISLGRRVTGMVWRRAGRTAARCLRGGAQQCLADAPRQNRRAAGR